MIAFKQLIIDFRAECQKSDSQFAQCLDEFSQALGTFLDIVPVSVQNHDVLLHLGQVVQSLYEQHQVYQVLVRERYSSQAQHAECVRRAEAYPMRPKIREMIAAWRAVLDPGLLTQRSDTDLDEFMLRIDRLIGLALPGWSLQTLRTQVLLQQSANNNAAGYYVSPAK